MGNDIVTNITLINAFAKTLESDELEDFNSHSYKEKMEIINRNEYKMTPLWSMSNLSKDDSDRENLAKLNEYQKDLQDEKDYRMGLTLQKIPQKTVMVSAAPKNPELVSDVKDKKEIIESPTPAKTTNYVVQLGETIEGMAKKSLAAEGKDTSDEKELAIAKQKIIADNKKLIKTSQKGRKFFLAGETIILQGEIDITGNKTAKEVKQEYKEKFAKK